MGMTAFIEFFYDCKFCNNEGPYKILYTVPGYQTVLGAESDNVYDTMIQIIERLVKSSFFNKEYLNPCEQ